MYLSDYTIPEAEVIYQKAVIRGAWWFFVSLVIAVFLYFVIKAILEDQKDYREHQRFMARQKSNRVIGQAAFDRDQASQSNVILKQKKEIASLLEEIDLKDEHIFRLEQTMKDCHFGDVAERIRKEIEDGKNESEDRR